MHTGFNFLSDPYFYYLLAIGGLAMLPRARFTADRAAAPNQAQAEAIKPDLAQRLCLLLPGLCLLSCVMMLRYATGAAVLLVAYLLAYMLLILLFKIRR